MRSELCSQYYFESQWFCTLLFLFLNDDIVVFQTGQVLGRVNMVSGHVKTQLIAHDKEVNIAFCYQSIYVYE